MNDYGRRLLAAISARTWSLRRDERGATAAEYALLLTFIAITIVGAVSLVGETLSTTFTKITDGIAVGTAQR